jgi:hypothetical protein
MDRKLFGLGQKGFDWAKKKVEERLEGNSGQHNPQSMHQGHAYPDHGRHPAPSNNQSQYPYHPQGSGEHQRVCFEVS